MKRSVSKSKTRSLRNWLSPYTVAVALLIIGTLTASNYGARFVYKEYRKLFPDVTALKKGYFVATHKEGHKIFYELQKTRPAQWKTLQQISRQAVGAILMAEDGGFFTHRGYEPEAIRMAIEHNSRPGVKIKRGGSTITQQVVKNLFLSPDKTVSRKVRELLLSVEVERKISKAKILEVYLNIAEWGPGIYGIERASWHYFQKPSSLLNAREGAILAFMLPNPAKYRFSYRGGELSEFGSDRVEKILYRMWKNGYIEAPEPSHDEEDFVPSTL